MEKTEKVIKRTKECLTPLKKTVFKGETKIERMNNELLKITLARKENKFRFKWL